MTQRGLPVERRVRERRLSVEHVDRAFDEYIAAASTQFRGPLRSILKLARLLGEYDGAPDACSREYAEHIRANAEHMTAMFKDLRRPAASRATVDECRSSSRPVAAR